MEHLKAKAYFDESGSEDRPGYFGIAGFAGSVHQWGILEALWKEALEATGAPYLHMREFAHSVEAFADWKGDKERREKLMAGVVKAVLESELTPIGSAMRTTDFDALPDAGRKRLVSPYFCCFQDIVYGFALMTRNQPVPVIMEVIGDQRNDIEGKVKRLYAALRERGEEYANLAPELTFADMRDTVGIQAADLLAYEMTKELNNQDLRPEDRVRWAFDKILADAESSQGKMLRYNTAASLQVQAKGRWEEQGDEVMRATVDESLRILRGKDTKFKEILKELERDGSDSA